jgi:hypothetical protein
LGESQREYAITSGKVPRFADDGRAYAPVNRAVYEAGADGVAISCEPDPPSDHERKVTPLPAASLWLGAVTGMRQPSQDVTVVGAMTRLPATLRARRSGSVLNVRSTVRGKRFRETVVLSPPESVALRITSRWLVLVAYMSSGDGP